ncbi:hypothetical protein E1293_10995 [Actinomadura darangshiensis]|uniref:Uncharacterized protein n=1 Tax=Actinomadura darangshiensis TaxID=705336 RepID=A0A4R5BIS0_9ACTN|nr:hypothetical protein [Actinomadura darangshiensis]TDD85459.1 hypothetical protein E1293_10995 [Actinomadura darangshiensis]
MRFRRLVAIGVLLTALGLLAGCGAGAPNREQRARVEVAVLDDGGALVDLYAAGRLESDAEVRALAGRVARRLFPRAADVRVRTTEGRGTAFARAEIDRAYRTGRTPSLHIDTSGALRELTARGFDDTAVKLRLPPVPATSAQPSPARLRKNAPAPVVDIAMRPEPKRWYGAMALPVLGAAGVVLGFFVRRRSIALPSAGVAVVTAVLSVTLSAGRQGANLGVAGKLGGTALDVASVAPLTAVPIGLPAAMLLVTVAVRWFHKPVAHQPEMRPRDTGVFW